MSDERWRLVPVELPNPFSEAEEYQWECFLDAAPSPWISDRMPGLVDADVNGHVLIWDQAPTDCPWDEVKPGEPWMPTSRIPAPPEDDS